MLVYSFLTKEFRGGVIWEFSLAAYDQFLFDRGLFGDEAPKYRVDLYHDLHPLDPSGAGGDGDLPDHWVPDSFLHCDPPAFDPDHMAVPGDCALLGEPADPHRVDEIPDPRQWPAERGAAWGWA